MSGTGFTDFFFASPHFLWLLLGLPLLMWLRGKSGGRPAVVFSSIANLKSAASASRFRAGGLSLALSLLAIALWIVALARPQLRHQLGRLQTSGVDIMLVLDVSRSMLAEDFTIGGKRANRLEAVRMVVDKFIASRRNDRIGIMAFAGRPYLVSPLTLDHSWLLKNLDRIRIGLVEDGTAIGSAIAAAAARLKDKPAKSRIMVLLSDGDNNAGRIQPLTAAEAARALGIKIYTVGAGSRGLVPFPFTDPFGRTIYRQVEMGFDENTLQQIASITAGRYFRATDTRSLIEVFSEIDRLEKTDVQAQQLTRAEELFPWFLGAGLLLMSLDMFLSATLWRRVP